MKASLTFTAAEIIAGTSKEFAIVQGVNDTIIPVAFIIKQSDDWDGSGITTSGEIYTCYGAKNLSAANYIESNIDTLTATANSFPYKPYASWIGNDGVSAFLPPQGQKVCLWFENYVGSGVGYVEITMVYAIG